MSVIVFWPDEEQLTKAGFGRVARVPCLFDGDWRYQRIPSTYLIERALADWTPNGTHAGGGRRPTKASLRAFAEAISNFLEWTEARGKNWQTLTYSDDLLDGYQKEMEQGSWSAKGRPLAPSTINGRVQEACNFLAWTTTRGHRAEFIVPTRTQKVTLHGATSSHGHRARDVEVREGKVRLKPKTLRLPTDDEIRKWLNAIKIKRGSTKALMAELILKTAVRREEAAGWRVDTLPIDPQAWNVVGHQVSVSIRYGTKGTDFGSDAGDKIGPERTIFIPFELANKLHEYRRGARMGARAKWIKAAQTQSDMNARRSKPSPHLFLSEASGRRVTAKSLYEAWTAAGALPYVGWSPHLGRHYWACKTLLNEAKKRHDFMKSKLDKIPVDWVTANSTSDIQILIKPQLGHIDQRTSEMYLTWVRAVFASGEMQLSFQDHLDQIEVNEREGIDSNG